MPVTFSPTSLRAEFFPLTVAATPLSPSSLLAAACPQQSRFCASLLQSSLPAESHNTIAQRNGLVHTIVEAYNKHRHLRLRPDDVWTAILIQFNFFVNGRSEKLRSQFVAHEGKKQLVVPEIVILSISKNVVDPSLRAWILPTFSTTTTTDTIVASVIMMSSMKKYFDYKFCLDCGIPSVTLEGERGDWEDILQRIEKLKEYGVEAVGWYHLLLPVLAQFVSVFDNAKSKKNKEFWGKVCHYDGGGSGPLFLGGWVTAFCAFDEDGRWLGHRFKKGIVEHWYFQEFYIRKKWTCDIASVIDSYHYTSGQYMNTESQVAMIIECQALKDHAQPARNVQLLCPPRARMAQVRDQSEPFRHLKEATTKEGSVEEVQGGYSKAMTWGLHLVLDVEELSMGDGLRRVISQATTTYHPS
ncbi:uncharacterized protein LACBIDRAFT_334758 [Laccaria bicolor S238N-H82]|uniref:Predicted protein n=1 Tax=Laccaria bicolor (strain S238N-H82 / ATCC MYA-4686) TaxID=486041 RepID=B0E075_LACBS|nr:uncharacterized protein LACBIDRAFT_334758 [Laccaria bicolor S238N-H82]EDQ99736.1 predicted protein [Laccaria bicolor S238N-H82]|eukprot:XP_001889572.1 predicted protein [Laccaria bicolor S238N-H82]